MTVFLHYDQAALDRQYDQRAWAPNAAEVIRRYAVNSDLARARLGEPQSCKYGPSGAETLDLYSSGQAQAPLHVFIHGGAWRLLSKRESAFAAEMFVRAGAHFAALDFALLPAASLAVMAAQVRRAIVWLYQNAQTIGADRERIYISGHSSGAHLAALAAVTDWPRQYGLPAGIVKGALCASGIYDLAPVRLSARNEYLRLDDELEQTLSPQRHLDRLGCDLIIAFADGDSDEFRRQAESFARSAGARARLLEAKCLNHFELAEMLADPDGLLGGAALAQMGLSTDGQPA
jgi:arylformamidase